MMKLHRIFVSLSFTAVAFAATATGVKAGQTFSEEATGAAQGYCLAKHLGGPGSSGNYNADGFEYAKSGNVGAVRRNFVHMRNPSERQQGGVDSGLNQTCEKACRNFGLARFGAHIGVPLHVRDPNDSKATPQTSGLEMASNSWTDWDFYMGKEVVAGIWGAPGWHEADVAQADFCCCQLGPQLNPDE
jgi:hypothetical protein